MTINHNPIPICSHWSLLRIRPDMLICLVLLFSILVIYRQVTTYEIESFEDKIYVAENPKGKDGLFPWDSDNIEGLMKTGWQ